MSLVTANRPISRFVLIVHLSCGHRVAVEGKPEEWPIGREYACPACQTPEPFITTVAHTPGNLRSCTIYLSCGHFSEMPLHHGLCLEDVMQCTHVSTPCQQCDERNRII